MTIVAMMSIPFIQAVKTSSSSQRAFHHLIIEWPIDRESNAYHLHKFVKEALEFFRVTGRLFGCGADFYAWIVQ
jgi:hypothetical protein